MSKISKILLLIISGVMIFLVGLFWNNINTWKDLPTVVSLTSILTSMGLWILLYQFVFQKKTYSLDQVNYMLSLANNFLEEKRKSIEAWQVLKEYNKCPQKMNTSEWYNVFNALEINYKAILFIYKLARLVSEGIIDSKLLYLFYYDDITEIIRYCINDLIKWCGTGLDLASNYDAKEIARLIKTIKLLIECLNKHHKSHGGEVYEFLMKDINDIEDNFVKNVEKYICGSDSYIDNYLTTE